MSTKKISIVEIILWFTALILILLSLTPYALGFKIKSDYAAMVTEFSELTQADFKIIKYDQGFFSSTAVIALTLPDMPQQLQFKENIIHGPVYFGLLAQGRSPLVAAVVKGEMDIDPSQQKMVRKIFGSKNPLVYQTTIDFSGNLDSQFYVPSVNTHFEDESGTVYIQSSGVVMNQQYSMQTGMTQGELKMPAFKMKSELSSVHAESISMSFSGTMGGNEILIGDTVVSLNLLDIDSDEEQFAMRDLVVRSETSESAGLLNSGTRITVRELLASNQKFGPVVFDINLNGINAESLTKIQDIQTEVEEKLEEGMPPEQVNAMMMGQVMGVIPDLVKQAELKIDPLSVSSELGKLEADLNFTLDGINADTPADPMFLLGAISLDFNFSIDEQLLRQLIAWELKNNPPVDIPLGSEKNKNIESNIPVDQKVSENIKGMLDENWLILNEGVYLSKISMHEGALLINDKPVDPMQQIMSSMGDGAEAN